MEDGKTCSMLKAIPYLCEQFNVAGTCSNLQWTKKICGYWELNFNLFKDENRSWHFQSQWMKWYLKIRIPVTIVMGMLYRFNTVPFVKFDNLQKTNRPRKANNDTKEVERSWFLKCKIQMVKSSSNLRPETAARIGVQCEVKGYAAPAPTVRIKDRDISWRVGIHWHIGSISVCHPRSMCQDAPSVIGFHTEPWLLAFWHKLCVTRVLPVSR